MAAAKAASPGSSRVIARHAKPLQMVGCYELCLVS
jgi:hypothetical protein